jgi:hypothetical protein
VAVVPVVVDVEEPVLGDHLAAVAHDPAVQHGVGAERALPLLVRAPGRQRVAREVERPVHAGRREVGSRRGPLDLGPGRVAQHDVVAPEDVVDGEWEVGLALTTARLVVLAHGDDGDVLVEQRCGICIGRLDRRSAGADRCRRNDRQQPGHGGSSDQRPPPRSPVHIVSIARLGGGMAPPLL